MVERLKAAMRSPVAVPAAAGFVAIVIGAALAWWDAADDETSVGAALREDEAFFTRGTPPPGVVPADDQRAEAATIDRSYADAPRTLTADECAEARPRMEALARLMAKKVQELNDAAQQKRFDGALAESRAWFDAGCPAHPRLGFYPALDGSGSKNILIDF